MDIKCVFTNFLKYLCTYVVQSNNHRCIVLLLVQNDFGLIIWTGLNQFGLVQNRFGLVEGQRRRLIPYQYSLQLLSNFYSIVLLVFNVFIELEALALVVNSCVESEFLTIALEECSIMRYITH